MKLQLVSLSFCQYIIRTLQCLYSLSVSHYVSTSITRFHCSDSTKGLRVFAWHPPERGGLTNNTSKIGLFFESTINSGFNHQFVIARNEHVPQGERAFDSKTTRTLLVNV